MPSIIEEIRSAPHWRINIRPSNHNPNLIESRAQCREIVSKARVHVRGLDFPIVNRDPGASGTGSNYVESWITAYGGHYWRLFQSGQFVCLFELQEYADEHWRDSIRQHAAQSIRLGPPGLNWSQVPGFVELVNLVYTITEVFEFTARLSALARFADQVSISIGIHHIEGFVLATHSPRRFWPSYCAASTDSLENAWDVDLETLAADATTPARDAIVWMFQSFGWDDPNVEQIKKDQDSLLRR